MKIASTIARYLMGIIFVVFGSNGFLHFIPLPPPPPSLALDYMVVLTKSNYFFFVYLVQLVAGILFLANRYVPLALTIVAPVIVNILLFHVLMQPEGLAPGAIATICWILVFLNFRSAFNGIFQAKA